MVSYPILIKASSNTKSGVSNDWVSGVESFPKLNLSIPREFNGPNTNLSPEDLFGIALVNCYVATFKVVAERMKFAFADLNGNCEIAIDRDVKTDGIVRVTSAKFYFTLKGAEDRSKADRLLKQVSGQCILINSLQAKAEFKFQIAD